TAAAVRRRSVSRIVYARRGRATAAPIPQGREIMPRRASRGGRPASCSARAANNGEESTMDVRAVVVSAFAIGSLITACGGESARGKPVTEPKLTSAALKPASPSVNVSEDLARACKLQMNDIASAPKFDFDKSELLPADR